MLGDEQGLPNLVNLRSGQILLRNTWARLVLGAVKKERVMPKYLSIKHTIITFFFALWSSCVVQKARGDSTSILYVR